ncbi:hypothetical protein H696_03005 [Fonticula alba]|uniref:Complex 1 LYR protein n=1 Tax=Fonticula alba TaxID=691883 RepID=A0A058Z8R0_FONAL|nr:hypothetical protein H696_03005 [Fonticula alba]KCV70650.1 hypothetical protein H696_03005 [Fonticula alba]|eukprot:XP_009495166.1 hypothetical protein H696_03005 [Fonticula alba]
MSKIPDPVLMAQLRSKARILYRELSFIGQHDPRGFREFFHPQLRQSFAQRAHLTDPKDIQRELRNGERIKRELPVVYSVLKYRALRRAYGDTRELPADLSAEASQVLEGTGAGMPAPATAPEPEAKQSFSHEEK